MLEQQEHQQSVIVGVIRGSIYEVASRLSSSRLVKAILTTVLLTGVALSISSCQPETQVIDCFIPSNADAVLALIATPEEKYTDLLFQAPEGVRMNFIYPDTVLETTQTEIEDVFKLAKIVAEQQPFLNTSGFEDTYRTTPYREGSSMIIHYGEPSPILGPKIEYVAAAGTYNWVQGPRQSEIALGNYSRAGIAYSSESFSVSALIEACQQLQYRIRDPQCYAEGEVPVEEKEAIIHSEFICHGAGFMFNDILLAKKQGIELGAAHQAYLGYFSDKTILLPDGTFYPVALATFDSYKYVWNLFKESPIRLIDSK
jgi:hypothetical protein